MSNPILCERAGEITVLTLNRPEVGNRVTNEMLVELARLLAAAGDSRAILLRGAGADFCLGRELPPPPPGRTPDLAETRQVQAEGMLALCGAFERVPVPVIAAVQGRVHGGGCAIAGICDITIAADNAVFQLPEMDRGIPPCLAMAALYPRLPRKALVHLVYSTEPMDAPAALAAGLVSKVVPAAELAESAMALARRIAGYTPASVRAVKEYMGAAPALPRAQAVELAGDIIARVVSGRG